MLIQRDLFTSGHESYHTFRIPSIILTQAGSLLAFCEGRRRGQGDSGDIDILLRRSEDGGLTWSSIETVWADPGNTCGNPCSVVDRQSGAISLLLTHNLGTDVEHQLIDGTSKGTRTVWLTRSEDNGHTWSAPRNITGTTKKVHWTWYATGPGAGIQLRSGRLVIPCDHIEATSKKYFSHVIMSDDGGISWSLGGTTPQDQVNECEVVQLDDGRLMLNMRNYDRGQRTRAVSYSDNEGVSWSDLTRNYELIEPICQASLRRLETPEGAKLLFANPASEEKRENMTVRLSNDSGQTWLHQGTLHAGPAAYSCLVALPDRRAGCLYECGANSPYEVIRFALFDLSWLGAK